MKPNILLSPADLESLIEAGQCVVVDCRFDFADTSRGRADWLAGHIPGAAYAHLDDDLSSPIEAHTGRHPLPDTERFAEFLASTGWAPGRLLVAYDEGSNAVASRLWWLLRFYGQSAALLDGGLAAWKASGRSLEESASRPQSAQPVELRSALDSIVGSDRIHAQLGSGELLVLDARAGPRFTGETETLDTRAGHIPDAVNRPFGKNLQANGRFKPAEDLRREFGALLGDRERASVVHSCGSGVTACHNLFAMELAGLEGSRLYPGSWSEWIRDPERPIETGA